MPPSIMCWQMSRWSCSLVNRNQFYFSYLIFYYYYYFMCTYLCTTLEPGVHRGQKRPWTPVVVMQVWVTMWVLGVGCPVLEEHPMLLSTEPSPQPHKYWFFITCQASCWALSMSLCLSGFHCWFQWKRSNQHICISQSCAELSGFLHVNSGQLVKTEDGIC